MSKMSKNWQEEMDMLLAKMPEGESVKIPGRKGWRIKTIKTREGFDVRIFNPAPDEGERWYAVSSKGHPYGAPMIIEEPTLGILCRDVGIDRDGAIVGAMVGDRDGNVAPENRFSWSNLVYMKNEKFQITSEGEVLINDKSVGWIHTLYQSNKNRIKGWIAYTSLVRSKNVRLLEIGDLPISRI